jgi:hypothetical protein
MAMLAQNRQLSETGLGKVMAAAFIRNGGS